MGFKFLTIIVLLIVMSSAFAALASVDRYNNLENCSDKIDIKEIHIAIYSDEKEDALFYGPFGRTKYFMFALSDYDWVVGNTKYCLKPTLLSTLDILRGKLTKNKFSVLIYTPAQANSHLFQTMFFRLPRNRIRVRNIFNFVENGGGYLGICGGALVAGEVINKPRTFAERLLKRSCFGLSCIKIPWKTVVPLFSDIIGRKPEAMGELAYLWYSGYNKTNMSMNYHSGMCIDVTVSNNSSLFDDYLSNERRIRCFGSPAFVIPENPDREIRVLARYPSEELSDNESLRIHYWKYNGGFRGIFRGFFGEADMPWKGPFSYPLWKAFVLAADWERTDKIVETNFSNMPFMTTEIYPNENEGRIVLFSGHPEGNVWWGGYIVESEDTNHNNQYEGFYRWEDIIPEEETVEDEFSYNYWMIRRSAAWAAKIADNDLPPVYGPSQVCDIYPYEQPSSFIIDGNAKTSDGIISLDLYYRYSLDNESWSDWMLYSTDIDISDGWSWEFDAPDGTGYYQFYSIRHVEYGSYTETEKAPPGPDAIAYIQIE